MLSAGKILVFSSEQRSLKSKHTPFVLKLVAKIAQSAANLILKILTGGQKKREGRG